ncbi:structural constituent of epidermis [Xylographa vitiligo]|nr:structural constituent of epidermis [Xylographa vitiligo]
MKLKKSKPSGENQASIDVNHEEVLKTGRLRRLAKFLKNTTKYFHKHNIGDEKCESQAIGTIEQSQIEHPLSAATDTTEPDTDHEECQRSIVYPRSLDAPTQPSTAAESHDYVNTFSANTVVECCVTTAGIYENEVCLQTELQSRDQPVRGQVLDNESTGATLVNTELPSPSGKEHATPTTCDVVTDHTRHTSTSSTLPVSLRSHTSEPLLRNRYVEPSRPRKDSGPFELLLQEFKEIQTENSWNYLLDSRKTQHENEIAELCDNHEDEVKYLKADLEKANKRKDYLEARTKKEVLQKLAVKEELQVLQKRHHADCAQYEAKICELTERNLELVSIVSGMAANEANHREDLIAKTNELNQVKDYLGEVLVKAKEEMDHNAMKIQNLHYALDGTPMAEDIDVKGHLELKKQQVQQLSEQVVELSNELERADSEVARQQVKVDREVEKSIQNTERSQAVEAHLKSRLEIAESSKNEYLLLLNSNPKLSKDVRLQIANKVIETIGKEINLLIAGKAMSDAKLAATEDSQLALQFLHRDLRAAFEKKEKEIEDLKTKNEGLNGDKDFLDSELSILNEEKNQEIRSRDQIVVDYQDVVQALQEHINNLGGLGADARTAWVWNAKLAEVDHLNESLKQAQLVILEYEQRRHERQGIERLDACLAYNYDQVTHQQAEQLNLATEESARLRLVIQELTEATEAPACEASKRESQVARQLQSSDSEVINRFYVEGDSTPEVPRAADQLAGKYGFDDWGELEVFFRGVADNLGTDATLLNLIADYEAEIQRLRGPAIAPVLADGQPVEEVQNDRKIVRRVRGEDNLFAIYQKTALKGKGKAK